MTKPRFDPDDIPEAPKQAHDPSASYIDVGAEDDAPVDPLTGKRAEPEALEEVAPKAAEKSTRPPWWLVAFTLLIPVAVFLVWYMNWFGRPLSVATINEYLTSSNDHDVAHALIQISKQAQDAAEDRSANQRKLDQRYRDALAALREEKKGDDYEKARKELDAQYQKSTKNVDEEYNRLYRDLELTFEGALAFARNSGSRAPALVEAACGALGAMNRSDRFREQARGELKRLMQHSSKVVRRAAACNLANFNDRSGRDIVLEMLDDHDAAARANGVIALSRIGVQSDAQRLKKLSESDPDPRVREFAYEGYSALSGKVE